jgi:hypothetical protein
VTCIINWYAPAIGAVNIPVSISMAPALEIDSLRLVYVIVVKLDASKLDVLEASKRNN